MANVQKSTHIFFLHKFWPKAVTLRCGPQSEAPARGPKLQPLAPGPRPCPQPAARGPRPLAPVAAGPRPPGRPPGRSLGQVALKSQGELCEGVPGSFFSPSSFAGCSLLPAARGGPPAWISPTGGWAASAAPHAAMHDRLGSLRCAAPARTHRPSFLLQVACSKTRGPERSRTSTAARVQSLSARCVGGTRACRS